MMDTISFAAYHYYQDMLLQRMRSYFTLSLSDRDIEEMMAKRGFSFYHSTINRWMLHYSSLLDATFRNKKKRVGTRWRMDETYAKRNGTYYYRAVDTQDQIIDFLLTATRDKKYAVRFFKESDQTEGKLSLININQSGANKTGLRQVNRKHHRPIKLRQCKYLNNIVEQDHRRIKRQRHSMAGFKNFFAAQRALTGIEVIAMIKKGQMNIRVNDQPSFVEQSYTLAPNSGR